MYSKAWSKEEEQFIDIKLAQIKKDHPAAKVQVPFAWMKSLLNNTKEKSKKPPEELLPSQLDPAISKNRNCKSSEVPNQDGPAVSNNSNHLDSDIDGVNGKEHQVDKGGQLFFPLFFW